MNKAILFLFVIVQLIFSSTSSVASKRLREEGGDNDALMPKAACIDHSDALMPVDGNGNPLESQPCYLLALSDELLIKILQYKGVVKATGTVCKKLEMLRMDEAFPLVRRYDDEEEFELACANPFYPKSSLCMEFFPDNKSLAQFDQNIRPLVYLHLEYCELLADDAEQIGQLIKLQHLILEHITISLEDSFSLLCSIEKLVGLKQFSLNGRGYQCDMSPLALAQALVKLENLQHLNLSWCLMNCRKVGSEAMQALATSLTRMSNLRVLNLGDNLLGDEDLAIYSASLSKLLNLKKLNLSHNRFFNVLGMQALSVPLSLLVNLIELDLSYCALELEVLSVLAGFLGQLVKLETLNLNSNYLEPRKMEVLAPPLKQLRCLRVLNLNNYDLYNGICIGPQGMGTLATSLQKLVNLEKLYLAKNQLGLEGARALASALTTLVKLRKLGLNSNAIGPEGMRVLAAPLGQLVKLEKLDLNYNELGTAGVCSLASYLTELTSLRKLDLSHNGIGLDGTKALPYLLEKLPKLEKFNLSGNKLGPVGVHAFALRLSQLVNLEKLDIIYE